MRTQDSKSSTKAKQYYCMKHTHLSNVLKEDAPDIDHVVGAHHEINRLPFTDLYHTTEHCFVVVTRCQGGHCHRLYKGEGRGGRGEYRIA